MGLKLLRVGSSNISFSRFIDLLERPELEYIVFFIDFKQDYFRKIDNSIKLFKKDHLMEKVRVHYYKLPFIVRGLRKILFKINFNEKLVKFILKIYPNPLEKIINKYQIDAIWSGSHDFDGSNLLTWWILEKKYKIKVIRSYKEHRCKYLMDEKNVIRQCDKIILPSVRNMKEFEKLYNIDLKNKTLFADEDWRYSGLVNLVIDSKVDKLSSLDKEPHIVILSGVVTYGVKDSRRNSRYNYLNMIKNLIQSKIHVHLHTKTIMESTDNPVCSHDNQYFLISKESEYFHIENPLDLEKDIVNSYSILKKYDAGILHNYVEGEPINAFTKMNVPNRLFEYQIASVLPIVFKNTLLDVEDIVNETGFGLIIKNYDDLKDVLYDNITNNIKINISKNIVRTYGDFVSTLFHSINT